MERRWPTIPRRGQDNHDAASALARNDRHQPAVWPREHQQRQGDDPCFGNQSPQARDGLRATHAGHTEVQKNHVRPKRLGMSQPFPGPTGCPDNRHLLEAMLFQETSNDVQPGLVVVHEQNRHRTYHAAPSSQIFDGYSRGGDQPPSEDHYQALAELSIRTPTEFIECCISNGKGTTLPSVQPEPRYANRSS